MTGTPQHLALLSEADLLTDEGLGTRAPPTSGGRARRGCNRAAQVRALEASGVIVMPSTAQAAEAGRSRRLARALEMGAAPPQPCARRAHGLPGCLGSYD